MKVATCTPVDFVANTHFFGRDSGLLCRGFQAVGASCVSIMPGTASPDDAPDLMRCSVGELADASWWRSLGLDLVVLYAWGDPRYRQIAMAIRAAGIPLVQSLDTAGLPSPYSDFREWWRCLAGMALMPQSLRSRLKTLGTGLRDLLPSIFEKRRLGMIDLSDAVATVSPAAAESVRRFAKALGRPGVAEKVILVPHPVSPLMCYQGELKEKKVIAVGRWDRESAGQKDPAMLLAVLREFLAAKPAWSAEVIGRGGEALADRCVSWNPDTRARLVLTGAVERQQLATRYASSSILFCPSRYESFHISSGEALCCGCSVVVTDHPLLASTAWFTQDRSGSLAPRRTPASLLKAMLDEADAWEAQLRTPAAIANLWSGRLHAGPVAATLIDKLGIVGNH